MNAPSTDVDGQLAQRATTSGQWLASLIAAAMLDTLSRPAQLPADLFPHVPQDDVQAIWNRALAVGYRAGQLSGAPRLHRDTLHRLQTVLETAGHTAMATLVSRSTNTLPAGTSAAEEQTVREECW